MFLWFLLTPSSGSAAQGVPEDGGCKLSETSVVNGHGVICQNSWIFINNAAGTTCVAVCVCVCVCVRARVRVFRITSAASQNNDLPII